MARGGSRGAAGASVAACSGSAGTGDCPVRRSERRDVITPAPTTLGLSGVVLGVGATFSQPLCGCSFSVPHDANASTLLPIGRCFGKLPA
eukprot:4694667-Prymnesium_polylepis.1